jgi:hypothetical protein
METSKGIHQNMQSQFGISQLYNLTIQNLNLKNYKNAIFFAEKLVSIDPKMKDFVYLLGECYFMN